MYTERLKQTLILDISLIIALPIAKVAYQCLSLDEKIPYHFIALVLAGIWIIVKLIAESKYPQFQDIWYHLPPRWLVAAFFIGIILALAYLLRLDVGSTTNGLLMLLLGYQDYTKDKYAYKCAKFFKMDQIADIKELVDMYPNARYMLNKHTRKQLKIMEG